VELGTNANYGVEGAGTIRFQLESRGSLEVVDVLYVLWRWQRCVFFLVHQLARGLDVELGTNAKCGIVGVGIVKFQLESGGSLEVENVLYVLELKKNLLSVLAMEDRG